jgi:hypothetical protein
VAFVYFLSFASLTHQILPSAGSGGYAPISQRLARMRRDFPTWRRFFYFPTLSWVSESDLLLGSFPWLGMIASAAAFVGGPFTPWAFVACYAMYLSIDRVMVLMFPWDCMLFEAGFFAMFLPPVHVLPGLDAVAAPIPALAWVYRLLLFRVLLGFGKFKFIGATSDDNGYLKGFLVNQPLPSVIGWYAQKLPVWALKVALVLMFVIEIPIPFTMFFPGAWAAAGGLVIAAFMVAIWLSGTFGYFSLVMIVVSVSWLDTATARALSFVDFFSLGAPAPALRALILLHTIGSAISFGGNSYVSMTWLNWALWERVRPRFLVAPLRLYRALHPFRWLHSYGVFPPHPSPPVKMVAVMEASWDGDTWHTLEHHYSPTRERSAPKFCAPYHARLDQALIYETFGLSDTTVVRNMVGQWDPYSHTHAGGSMLMMRRALKGYLPELVFDPASIPAPHREKPPIAARVRTHLLEPLTLKEHAATGHWWRRSLIGPHSGTVPDDGFNDHGFPPPELWHFEDIVWLRRSSIGRLMERAARGEDPHALVLVDGDDITAEDVARFWSELVPSIGRRDRSTWRGIRAVVNELRAAYGAEQMYRFERIAGRYGAVLLERLEPLFAERSLRPLLGKAKPTLDAKTHYHLGLLTREVMAHGKEAYDAVFASPAKARPYLDSMTLASGGYLLVVFRYEMFVSQSSKFRLVKRYVEHEGRRPLSASQRRGAERVQAVAERLFGAVEMIAFLRTQFQGEDDLLDVPERWPTYVLASNGELVRAGTELEILGPEPVTTAGE